MTMQGAHLPGSLQAAAAVSALDHSLPMVIWRPVAAQAVVVNSGMGWIAHGLPAEYSDAAIGYCSAGYMRFDWSELNPSKGVYNWGPIDAALTAWVARKKQFSFGVMALNSHRIRDGYATPRWVFDSGARGVAVQLDSDNLPTPVAGHPGVQQVPDFADVKFQEAFALFVSALAERYDGNANLAFVDCRGYGNWGENHMFPFTKNHGLREAPSEVVAAYIHMYRTGFTRTKLLLPWGLRRDERIYDKAVECGLGMRRDGVGPDDDGTSVAFAYAREPILFELVAPYSALKRTSFSLLNAVERGRPTWVQFSSGSDAENWISLDSADILKISQRIGFQLSISVAVVPSLVTSGVPFRISLEWLNRGVAPLLRPISVAVALLDMKDEVVDIAWLGGDHLTRLLPGTAFTQASSVCFSQIKEGDYRLAIGLVEQRGASVPLIRLALAEVLQSGWFPLGSIQVRSPIGP